MRIGDAGVNDTDRRGPSVPDFRTEATDRTP